MMTITIVVTVFKTIITTATLPTATINREVINQ